MRGSGIFHAVFLYPAAPIPGGGLVPAGHLLRRLSQCCFRLSPGDARGKAPCIRKLKIPPSPEGKGVGGMGAEKQAKNRVGRRQGRHVPRRALAPQAQPMPLLAQPRGCKGRSPLHKKTKNPPLPAGKGGKGDGGKKALLRQANPATEKVSPPADAATALFPNAAPGSSAGAPERRPPAPHRASPRRVPTPQA